MSRIAVLGATGTIGAEIVARLTADGDEIICVSRRLPATAAGTCAVRFDLAFDSRVPEGLRRAETVISALPSQAGSGYVARILDEGIPVISVGHTPVWSNRAPHVRCAGALPGVLVGVPLFLTDRSSETTVRIRLSGLLSPAAAADIVSGSRRDGDGGTLRGVRMPGVDGDVDLVAFADDDTRFVEERFGGALRWWTAWSGSRFRDALFAAAGREVDEAAAMLVAASQVTRATGPQVLAHAASQTEAVTIQTPTVAGLCAATAIYCARRIVGSTELTGDMTAVGLLGDDLRSAVEQLVHAEHGTVRCGSPATEEGEL